MNFGGDNLIPCGFAARDLFLVNLSNDNPEVSSEHLCTMY
jgi:hypothetical protein